MSYALKFSALALTAIIVTGCSSGGSGGDNVGISDEPEPNPDPAFSLAGENARNPKRVYVTEDHLGQEGDSVVVAVADSGVDKAHTEMQGRNDDDKPIMAGGFDALALQCNETGGEDCGSVDATGDENGHGTAVSSIVAGIETGYAGNARVLAVDASDRADGSAAISNLLVATSEATDREARIINASYSNDLISGRDPIWDIDPDSYYGQKLENVRNSDIVYVTSAGNGREDYSATYNTQNTWDDDDPLLERTLLVGALDESDVITEYSAGPGADPLVQSQFIFAPGTNESAKISPTNDAYQQFTGTSSAAPVVSAGLASVLAGWSHLSAVEGAQILLDSADKSFTTLYERDSCGESDDLNCGRFIYGEGKLDVEAALTEPVGEARLATGERVDDARQAAARSYASMDGAMAAARPALADALSEVAIFDDYGRDFQVDLSGQVVDGSQDDDYRSSEALNRVADGLRASEQTRTLGAFEQRYQFTGDNRIARMDFATQIGPVGVSAFRIRDEVTRGAGEAELGPEMAMLADPANALAAHAFDEGLGMGATTKIGEMFTFDAQYTQGSQSRLGVERVDLAELGAGYRLNDHWQLHMGLAQAREEDGFMGLQGAGALGTDGSGVTIMPSIGIGYTQGDWGAFASYAQVKGGADYADSLIESVDATLHRMSAGVDYAFNEEREQLALVASTPLHVRDGSASLAIPTGRTDAGDVTYNRRSVSLEPSDVPMDLELGYRRAISKHAEIGANLLRSERDGEEDYQASVTARWRF